MEKLCEFLRSCGAFFVLTINEDFPAGRPFGAVMAYDGSLYITTPSTKAVYSQLKAHREMQIVALKPGTREWVRISGLADEIYDLSIKQKMLDECQNLRKYHRKPDEDGFNVFKVTVVNYEFK